MTGPTAGRRGWVPAAGLVMAIAYPGAIGLAIAAGSTFEIVFTASFVTYPVVGLLIAWYRSGNAIGRLFVVLGLAVPLGIAASGYAQLGLPAGRWAGWASSLSFPVIFGGLLIFLPLLFPTGTYLTPRWRRFGRFALVLLAALAAVFAVSPGELECCPGVASPIQIPQLAVLEAILPFLFPVVVATSLASLASLVLRFRRSRGIERQQLKWFTLAVGSICVIAVLGALNSVGIVPDNEIAPLIAYPTGIAAIALAVGVAILRHRLYDIDIVIRRTLVYGALTASLAAVYVGGVLLLQAVLGTFTEGNALAVAASTLAVAALFRPMRTRIQRAVDRRFYRSRYDAARTIEAFGARLRDQVDLDRLAAELGDVVGETLQPASVSVWLRRP